MYEHGSKRASDPLPHFFFNLLVSFSSECSKRYKVLVTFTLLPISNLLDHDAYLWTASTLKSQLYAFLSTKPRPIIVQFLVNYPWQKITPVIYSIANLCEAEGDAPSF